MSSVLTVGHNGAAHGAGERPSPDERAARGRDLRAEVPRSAHAAWAPGARDPVAILEEQARSRLPDLVPIRYGRMLAGPFAFYRGAAAIMAADLAGEPRTGLRVQLCGDAHLSNLGAFAAPDRRMVFSINDFDETLPGPFEWDVKRLVASFAVAGRERGFSDAEREAINLTVARAYREAMAGFARMRHLDLWYVRLDVDEIAARWEPIADAAQRRKFRRTVAKAQAKDSLRAFAKLTEVVDGERRIRGDPPLIVPIEEIFGNRISRSPEDLVRAYGATLPLDRRMLLERYHYAHAARKVVGVGSVGTRAWIILLLGRDGDDPLFLQAKEAEASVLEPHLGASGFSHHGQRVVEGQRLTQAAADVLLGWVRTEGPDGIERDFYVRQLWDAKGSATVETMVPKGMTSYAVICGWSLARAHARSGDAMAIAGYLGSGAAFDRALAAFAEAYADQNERDHRALADAVAAGRLEAELGV